MCQVSDWLEKLVLDVRVQAFRHGLTQAEVVRRLRNGEALEALFPDLEGSLHGMTTAYLLWELESRSWNNHSSYFDMVMYGQTVGQFTGKSGHIHHLILGLAGRGMGFTLDHVRVIGLSGGKSVAGDGSWSAPK